MFHTIDIPYTNKSMKFDSVENIQLELPISNIFEKRVQDNKDIAIVYFAWHNPMYVKYMYISYISQLLYTDIENHDVYIICDDLTYFYAKEVFKNFNVTVIYEDSVKRRTLKTLPYSVANTYFKYSIREFDFLLDYKLIAIVDSDAFFYGKKIPIYNNIVSLYDKTANKANFPILMCEETTFEHVLYKRRPHLAKLYADDEEYSQWIAKRLDIPSYVLDMYYDKQKWFLSCFICFDNTKFIEEDWLSYADQSFCMYNMCDESVFLTYAMKKLYDVADLSVIQNVDYYGILDITDEYDIYSRITDDKLYVNHLVQGEYAKKHRQHQKYFQTLINEFCENYIQPCQKK